MKCPQCGTEIQLYDRFCAGCGAAVDLNQPMIDEEHKDDRFYEPDLSSPDHYGRDDLQGSAGPSTPFSPEENPYAAAAPLDSTEENSFAAALPLNSPEENSFSTAAPLIPMGRTLGRKRKTEKPLR